MGQDKSSTPEGLLADLKKIGEFLPHEPNDTETSEWHYWIELDEAYSRVAEALESLPSARGDSTGWLIEAKHNEYTMWWRSGDCGSNYGEPNWTQDAFKAVRFVRQEDAQAVIDSWPVWAKHEFKATDHLFMSSYVKDRP